MEKQRRKWVRVGLTDGSEEDDAKLVVQTTILEEMHGEEKFRLIVLRIRIENRDGGFVSRGGDVLGKYQVKPTSPLN